LHLHAVADGHPGTDHAVLAEGAVLADRGVREDVAEVPSPMVLGWST
jgi:hypothetical protein